MFEMEHISRVPDCQNFNGIRQMWLSVIALQGGFYYGNEADSLGILQKLVPHRSLTLPFELFRFWLRIRGDIRN